MYIYICICTYICICYTYACMYICIYIYIYTISTHIQTYIYIYTCDYRDRNDLSWIAMIICLFVDLCGFELARKTMFEDVARFIAFRMIFCYLTWDGNDERGKTSEIEREGNSHPTCEERWHLTLSNTQCSLPWCKATQKSSLGTPFASSNRSVAECWWQGSQQVLAMTMHIVELYGIVDYKLVYNLWDIATFRKVLPRNSVGARNGGNWEIPFQRVSNSKGSRLHAAWEALTLGTPLVGAVLLNLRGVCVGRWPMIMGVSYPNLHIPYSIACQVSISVSITDARYSERGGVNMAIENRNFRK